MEFQQVISTRFSCKNFSDREVEKEKLQRVLEATRLAPTAKNLQEHKIYVMSKPEDLAKIDTLTVCRYHAPVVLVICYQRQNVFHYPGNQKDSGTEDASIIATYAMLAATNEGLDSCWVNFFDPQEVAKAFVLPDQEEVVMMLDLGYRSPMGQPKENHYKRKTLDQTVVYR